MAGTIRPTERLGKSFAIDPRQTDSEGWVHSRPDKNPCVIEGDHLFIDGTTTTCPNCLETARVEDSR